MYASAYFYTFRLSAKISKNLKSKYSNCQYLGDDWNGETYSRYRFHYAVSCVTTIISGNCSTP